jgi:hypothetical protein
MKSRLKIGDGGLKACDSDGITPLDDFNGLTVDCNPEIIRCNATERAGNVFKDTLLGVAHRPMLH